MQNQQYSSVPSQVAGNKENSKKVADGANGAKVALKAREFGREITNATASSSNAGSHANKQNQSVIIEQSTSSTAASAQNSSVIISTSSQVGASTIGVSHSRKTGESGSQSTKMVSHIYKNLNFNVYIKQILYRECTTTAECLLREIQYMLICQDRRLLNHQD